MQILLIFGFLQLTRVFLLVGKKKVLVKNVETGKQRIAQAVVLDPPYKQEVLAETEPSSSYSSRAMLIFPSCTYPETELELLDREVAYISPKLAFNLDLHMSCFKSLVQVGEEAIASYFKDKMDEQMSREGTETSLVRLQLEPLRVLPRYASHLRVSFVKIPECGTLESFKGSSTIEAESRQEMIDLALQNYFEVDRYLVRGDIFSVRIDWNCKSLICVPCSQSLKSKTAGTIYFKVTLSSSFFSFCVCVCKSIYTYWIRILLLHEGCSYGTV